MKRCFKSQRGRFLFEESARINVSVTRRGLTFQNAWHLRARADKKMLLKKPPLQCDLSYTWTQIFPTGCKTHTGSSHTHTHIEVKSTLLSCSRGANGLPLCITDPTLLLHLLSACSFLTLSISAPPPSPLSSFALLSACPSSSSPPIICHFVLCSSRFPVFWLTICFHCAPYSPVALAHTPWWMSNLVALYSAILVHVR